MDSLFFFRIGLVGLTALIVGCGAFQSDPASSSLPENFRCLSERVYSSGEPVGVGAFAALKSKGVRTIVSVDGALPDVTTARNHSIQYIHLPIGYDGVPPATVLALNQVMSATRGPILIHCHHGKHRGPAAAVIACMIEGSMNTEKALSALKVAGTSPDYAGLWRDVRSFRGVPSSAKVQPLVERGDVSPLASAMVGIDHAFESLEQHLQPSAQVDSAVLREQAVLLVEGFKESLRHADASDGHAALAKSLDRSLVKAQQLSAFIKASNWDGARALQAGAKGDCKSCHATFRN